MPKVLIAPVQLATLEGEYRQVLRDAGLELVFPNKGHQLVEDEILAALDAVSASVAGSEPYTARVLAAHPKLRVIARVGVGYDAVDVAAATKQGIAVCTTPNTNHDAVAEPHLRVRDLAVGPRVAVAELHEADYTPWEGRDLAAWPSMTMLRGKIVVEGGLFTGDLKDGQFLPRKVPDEIRKGPIV